MSRVLRLLFVGLVFAGVLGPVPASAQETVGAELLEVGWWTQRPGASEQEGNGFEVAAGVDGSEQSVAAMRFQFTADSVTSFEVILKEARALGTEFGGLKVCTTGPAWEAANPGDLEEAPSPDCSNEVGLTRSSSGSWLGDLGRLVAGGGEVSLMILPTYASPVGVGSGMVVAISEVEITAVQGTPTTTTTTTTLPASGGGGGGDIGGGGDTGASDAYDDNFFAAPAVTAPDQTATAPDPTRDAGGTVTEETSEGEEEFFTLGPAEEEAGEQRPWLRLILLVPLSIGVGAGVVYLRRFLSSRGIQLAG